MDEDLRSALARAEAEMRARNVPTPPPTRTAGQQQLLDEVLAVAREREIPPAPVYVDGGRRFGGHTLYTFNTSFAGSLHQHASKVTPTGESAWIAALDWRDYDNGNWIPYPPLAITAPGSLFAAKLHSTEEKHQRKTRVRLERAKHSAFWLVDAWPAPPVVTANNLMTEKVVQAVQWMTERWRTL